MTTYEPKERRPIAARNTRWAERVAGWLARKGVSPNAISIFGMASCILAGLVLAGTRGTSSEITERVLWIAAAALVQMRLLANLFDGMVAVQTGKASAAGELYNEVPDRVSDAAVFVGLGYSSSGSPAIGFLAAIAALFTAYVRAQGKAAGAPNDFCGPMAKQHRMFIVTVTCIAMCAAPFAFTKEWRLADIACGIVIAGCIVTSLRRLVRAGRALSGKSA